MGTFPDGLIVVVKRDCETCVMLANGVLKQLVESRQQVTIYTQDDLYFFGESAVDDTSLEASFHLEIETVPTLIRREDGNEVGRTVGWHRGEWEALSQVTPLGVDLLPMKPGCGARNVMPGITERLQVLYGETGMSARAIDVDLYSDAVEAAFERGWSDGLPVVPPTPERVWRMLQGTTRRPDERVAIVPPNMAPCTVEKVAINAVMAGCKPEYLPVVLAAVEAACLDKFGMHGILATTYFSGPIVIVNGPIAQEIGMNAEGNALGQGNRANGTIGRALQLIIRNIGGGLPGGVDRAALGSPGKYTFCFAEREKDSPWESLSAQMGFTEEDSTVTLFCGGGVQGFMDQLSREPESLTKSLAQALLAVCHPKMAMVADALLVLSPEHARVYKEAGWSKAMFLGRLKEYTMRPGSELIRGANGIAEGLPAQYASATVPKFRPGGLLVVHAGGTAGLFSAIIGGWPASGEKGSSPVTVKIRR